MDKLITNNFDLNEYSLSELPNYFFVLKINEIKEIISSSNKQFAIIAIGREAAAGKINLLTGNGKFICIKPKGLPEGRVIPSSDGKTVYFYDEKKEFSSTFLIENHEEE
jgi:hypothetical protein